MTFSTFLSTNHVRAYHVTLSCGLHGADDVVHAGEQKVKLFVLISEIIWDHNLALGPTHFFLSRISLAKPFGRLPLVLNSHVEIIILCRLDMII